MNVQSHLYYGHTHFSLPQLSIFNFEYLWVVIVISRLSKLDEGKKAIGHDYFPTAKKNTG